MPKSKPDIVHSVRIELQETERATLEAALAGRFVTNAAMAAGNLLNGVGAALAPFSGALTALAAVWIADRTLEQIIADIEKTKEVVEEYWTWVSPSKTLETYQYITAFMLASQDWPDLMSRRTELFSELATRNISPLLETKLNNFLKTGLMKFNTTGQWPPNNPAKAWTQFYSVKEYYSDHGLNFS